MTHKYFLSPYSPYYKEYLIFITTRMTIVMAAIPMTVFDLV